MLQYEAYPGLQYYEAKYSPTEAALSSVHGSLLAVLKYLNSYSMMSKTPFAHRPPMSL